MKEIKFSNEAQEDIFLIYDYVINNSSKNIADNIIEEIYSTLEIVCSFEKIGKEVIYDDINCREILCLRYIIFYIIKNDEIFVLTILDTSRNKKISFKGDVKKYE